jgi:putative transposase
MPYWKLYYHFVWATHSREPLIDRGWRPDLLRIVNDEVTIRGGLPLRHNAMPDHVHLDARLPPTVLISDFIGKVKGATSFRVNRNVRPKFKLQWQGGYGVLSLRRDELDKVYHYVDNQEEHHRSGRMSALLETHLTDEEWPEG